MTTDDRMVALIAGVLSTHPPHNRAHPAGCLTMARDVVRVLRLHAADQLTVLWDGPDYWGGV